MTLRSQAVEAMAAGVANDRAEEVDTDHRLDAEAALDALLGFLKTNADEWADEKADRFMSAAMLRAGSDAVANVLGLLAVLEDE